MQSYVDKVMEAKEYILKAGGIQPEIALILGSGLGDLADEVSEAVKLPYEEIPHFPVSTVEGHAGQLVIGRWQGKKVIIMQGRFHYYEGYSQKEVVFPIYVFKQLGVRLLVVTNACGGMNRAFRAGDLLLITDHINFTGDNPLIGPNHEALGPRFPDMSQAYSHRLIAFAEEVAKRLGIPLQKGVYVGISGPTYNTNQELSMLAKLGGDVVGMSTVPEVIAARHTGLEVLGISCITDMAIGGEVESISHEEVVAMANRTKPTFARLVRAIVNEVELA